MIKVAADATLAAKVMPTNTGCTSLLPNAKLLNPLVLFCPCQPIHAVASR